jgi:hypothetical protein
MCLNCGVSKFSLDKGKAFKNVSLNQKRLMNMVHVMET